MAKAKAVETDVAAAVVDFLEVQGYDVYQEVPLVYDGGIRADIVAKRGHELTIVETKTSGSISLLYQAMERRRLAHRIYVAVPVKARELKEVLAELGIGLLRVNIGALGLDTDTEYARTYVTEVLVSRRWNTRPLALASKLKPEHKTHAAAGSRTGGHFTRWKETCEQLARVVAVEPGLELKQVILGLRHHYSSHSVAVSSMAAHLQKGRVAGVVIRNGRLWPA